MASPSTPLRLASNILVVLLLLIFAAYLIDAATVWWGGEPYFSCTVLPTWLDISDPWPILLMVAGLILWGITRTLAAFLLFFLGLLVGLTPWILVTFADSLCN